VEKYNAYVAQPTAVVRGSVVMGLDGVRKIYCGIRV
jgi:hypothetical protein